MAANLKGGAIAGRLGKRVAGRIWAGRDPAVASRRAAHSSSYDKEVDDHVGATVVPDLPVSSGDQYWAPNPRTGVFGPTTEKKGVDLGSDPFPAVVNGSSVLEQKVWFRPQEDVEKPHSPTQ